MKYIPLALLLILSAAFVACKHKKDEKQMKYDEIMAIHDSTMKKMGALNSLKRALEKRRSILKDSAQIAENELVIKELDGADEAMTDWMYNWGQEVDKVKKSSPEYLEFLQKQKKAIINVSDQIYHAMEHAKKLQKEL